MKIVKRIFIALLVLIVLIVGAAIALPIIFKEDVLALVKEQADANLNATTDFSNDIDLSLFRSFPHLTLVVHDFSITGKDRFEGVPFVTAKEAEVTVDLKSLLGDDQPLQVRSVQLKEPFVNVLVMADGAANYDIAIATEEETSSEETSAAEGLELALQSYAINNGRINYDDRAGDILLTIDGLNHSGSGNLTLNEYDLDTETTINAMSLDFAGIGYLKNAHLALDAIFHINAAESLYVLKDNELQINELLLSVQGEVQLQEEDIRMDLAFNSPGSDFRSLWSLIPNAYTADYADVAIDGSFNLEGLVKGVYNETTYPAFRIRTKVQDGNVKYPDLQVGISNIQANVDVNSPSSDLNEMKINVQPVSLRVGEDPFTANIAVQTPISDPDVDARVKGVINLAQWARAFPMESVQEMAGIITADVEMRTKMSTIEREAYDQVYMAGDVKVDQLRYLTDGLPAVVVQEANADFTPQRMNVRSFNAQLGKSDLQASGHVNNILAYISPEKTMTGSFTAHSNYFLADEWLEEEETVTPVPAAAPATESAEVFDRFDFEIDATADKIVYDVYELTNTSTEGRIQPNRMEIRSATTQLGESDFQGNGTIINVFDYVFEDGILAGNLDLSSKYIDLNPFMETPEGTTIPDAGTEEGYGVIPIPANIDMTMTVRADRVHYTDMDLNFVRGKLTIADETVVIEDGVAQTLGGGITFTGAYDTQDVTAPGYNFKFGLDKLDFGQSFSTFNTFAAFAPIGKLVDGRFSSDLIMSGTLGEDMMPDLNTIDAEGLLETLNGQLTNGFKPLTAIGNTLDIDELKETIELDRLKTWFTIKEGTVEVEPFDVNVKDIPMHIQGTHSLTQDMNYTIRTVIPRDKLGNNALGNTVNQGVSTLIGQANQLGLNIEDAENVNVLITLTGNITNPKVGFKLLGTDGETSVAEAVQNEIRDQVTEQVDEVKDQVTAQVDDIKDEVTDQATALADSLKAAAAQQAQQAGQQVLDAVTGNATPRDSTQAGGNIREQAEGAVDKIKEDIKDFNPFRRKKKNDGGGGR